MKYRIDPREFDISFMRENGFIRKQCKSCKSYFWTQNPDQELCGEAPCVDYSFFGNSPAKRRLSIREMRRAFLSFFEENGHRIIEPYPVIARWRDDLLITIASIADFQPHVTSGQASPPANPLVVSQPCLRFEDIDKVGYTSGRHMTIFEMGGAHAFNNKKKGDFIYWKDKTIELHHKFATEVLGIDSEDITYKEHFWVGGGNAGPDVEGIIAGLEVSTLVFMMYRVDSNGILTETPIWTVDTGYGIERWTWLSQGVYNAFEAVYGEIYEWLLKALSIKIDPDAMRLFALRSPLLSEEDLPNLSTILEELGIEDYLSDFINLIRASKLLDYSKASLFLISDGGVPSNTGEGYLTRMLLRKIFKLIDELELELNMVYKLFEKQVIRWGGDFPRVTMVRDIVIDILDTEYRKYQDIIKKAPKIIENYLNKGYLPDTSLLIELYDSHGIHPEYVREYLRNSRGQNIDIPFNFTELVANKHVKSGYIKKEKAEAIDIPTDKTVKLYYTNQYLREAIARVVWAKDDLVVLDRTVFYPTGGGQVHDTGYIVLGKERYKVINVFDNDGIVIHKLDRKFNGSIDGSVKLILDWDRRYNIMKHHTSTHILLSAARRILGPHIWQAGVIKQPNYAHLDITHYKNLTYDEIKGLEEMVNRVIQENRRVNSYFIDRGDAERRYGVWIYQGGVVPGEKLRLIEVEDWDIEACGGTHVSETGEINFFKIIDVDKIQDGVVRITFKAGQPALEYVNRATDVLSKIASSLSVSKEHVDEEVEKLLENLDNMEKELRRLRERLASVTAENLMIKSMKLDDVKIIVYNDEDVDFAIKVSDYVDKKDGKYLFIGYSQTKKGLNVIVKVGNSLTNMISADKLAKEIASRIFEGYGGKGDRRYYRIGGRLKESPTNLNEYLLDIISDVVRGIYKQPFK